MDCSFCALIADPAAPIHQAFRDDVALAFLDHRPLFPGHLLVLPVRHVATLTDLPPELVGPFFGRVRLLTEAVERATAAKGSFVAMNNRVSQSVPHLHVHVVPRNPKDGLRGFFWPRHRYRDEAEARRIAERIARCSAELLRSGSADPDA
ncbi:HIT family protein [Kitasatospora sp. GAS204B]|uniref:HIT family protein n=1 Tax=unclassified Kitasatospora TaxID=2633591 RepID=UPI0024734423|nr:HIT family protein [Kitasatospora sp. GAS204B]MDH6121603.1 histidine triad (HIT) family protein [Kitasatospora sp. GAS204B]